MTTPTPRTDAFESRPRSLECDCHEAIDFARQLEQELNEARGLIKLLEDNPETYADLLEERDTLKRERDEARANYSLCHEILGKDTLKLGEILRERDQLRNTVREMVTTLRRKDKSLPTAEEVRDRISNLHAENDQLRKVADELALRLEISLAICERSGLRTDWNAHESAIRDDLNNHSQLPNVKQKEMK
jgi:hypothetical protein